MHTTSFETIRQMELVKEIELVGQMKDVCATLGELTTSVRGATHLMISECFTTEPKIEEVKKTLRASKEAVTVVVQKIDALKVTPDLASIQNTLSHQARTLSNIVDSLLEVTAHFKGIDLESFSTVMRTVMAHLSIATTPSNPLMTGVAAVQNSTLRH